MYYAPKYWNRELKDYEAKRYEELNILFEKCNQKPYWLEIINTKTWETLMDIACSKLRYENLMDYYQRAYEVRRKKEIEEEKQTCENPVIEPIWVESESLRLQKVITFLIRKIKKEEELIDILKYVSKVV